MSITIHDRVLHSLDPGASARLAGVAEDRILLVALAATARAKGGTLSGTGEQLLAQLPETARRDDAVPNSGGHLDHRLRNVSAEMARAAGLRLTVLDQRRGWQISIAA